MKFCFSMAMVAQTISGAENYSQKITWLVSSSTPMLVPGLAYLAMNLLSFVALRHIDAGLFTVFAQACKLAAVGQIARSRKPIKAYRVRVLLTRRFAPCRQKF